MLQRKLDNALENHKSLQNDKTSSYEKMKILEEENMNLKKKVEKLKPLVDKLTLSSNKLELLLRDQKESKDKARIG